MFLIAPESSRLGVAVTVNVFTGLWLMGLEEQQMGEDFCVAVAAAAANGRSLTVQFAESPGWWHVQAAFHICCLHMGNLTLLFSRRAREGPNKIISLRSRRLPSLPAASPSCHPLSAVLSLLSPARVFDTCCHFFPFPFPMLSPIASPLVSLVSYAAMS